MSSDGPGRRAFARLRSLVDTGSPILVAGVGSGITARGAVDGGADVLAAYHTAIFRIRNLPTVLSLLPGEEPNRMTFGVAPEVVASAGDRPVVLGLSAHDPRVHIEALLDRVEALGAVGVTNEPFIGVYGEAMRHELDRVGCGFARESALIKAAARRGLLTLGWACDSAEARALADAGADLLGAMIGFTSTATVAPGDIVAAVAAVRSIAEAAIAAAPDIIVLAHGGVLNEPAAVATVMRESGVHGYITGSSAERQPIAAGMAQSIRQFRTAASEARRDRSDQAQSATPSAYPVLDGPMCERTKSG